MKDYSKVPRIKENMDRLQSEDECCGAENYLDWLENDWVPPQFNPLLNDKTPAYEKSIYYPWTITRKVGVSDRKNDQQMDPQNYEGLAEERENLNDNNDNYQVREMEVEMETTT